MGCSRVKTDFPVRTTPTPRLSDTLPPGAPKATPLPPVALPPPDLTPWFDGNTGLPGVHRFQSPRPGPHVAVTALMHGNEYAGAAVLAGLLQRGYAPGRGTLSLIFLNIQAFRRFSIENPVASRFVEEDMNRLWDGSVRVTGVGGSVERRRVCELLPYLETVDRLLDLHSTLWPVDPFILSGDTRKGRSLARALADPCLIVADGGHRAGPRLIDLEHFTSPDTTSAACLLEAGQHWSADSVAASGRVVDDFLRHTLAGPEPEPLPGHKVAEVTHRITARTGVFTFTQAFRNGEAVARRGTLIATDGPDEIRTPYDRCLLILPNFRAARRQTAVRLARLVEP